MPSLVARSRTKLVTPDQVSDSKGIPPLAPVAMSWPEASDVIETLSALFCVWRVKVAKPLIVTGSSLRKLMLRGPTVTTPEPAVEGLGRYEPVRPPPVTTSRDRAGEVHVGPGGTGIAGGVVVGAEHTLARDRGVDALWNGWVLGEIAGRADRELVRATHRDRGERRAAIDAAEDAAGVAAGGEDHLLAGHRIVHAQRRDLHDVLAAQRRGAKRRPGRAAVDRLQKAVQRRVVGIEAAVVRVPDPERVLRRIARIENQRAQ